MASSWQNSSPTAYSGGSFPYYTTTGYSTTVDAITVYGEWIEINIPNADIVYSYSFGTSDKSLLPTSWIIAGSNSHNGPWSSIPNTTNNSSTPNKYTIPSSVITSYETGIIPRFTIHVNTTIPYSCYRIIFTSAYSNTVGIGINHFYMNMLAYMKVTVAITAQSYLPLATNITDIGLSPQTVNQSGTLTYATILGKQCIYFDNNMSNYLYFNFSNPTQLTFCYWIYVIDSGYYTAVSISNVGTLNPSLQCDFLSPTVYLFAALPNHWTVGISNGNTAFAGKWIHVAYTINQSTRVGQIYINGTLAASGTGSGVFGKSITSFIIGRSGDNGRGFYGYIREFQFYNTVLTTEQIATIYTSTA